MKINPNYGFCTCNKCGESFQAIKLYTLEYVDENGETVVTEYYDTDWDKISEMSDAHDKQGCVAKDWSWDDIEYVDEDSQAIQSLADVLSNIANNE